jgi:hypothetical protein
MAKFIDADSADVAFYNVVRSNLTSIDGLRLTAARDGIAIPLTILIAVPAVIHYVHEDNPMAYIAGAFLFLGAIFISYRYTQKVKLYSNFITEAVDVAEKIEVLLGLDINLCLTYRFGTHRDAGRKGAHLFVAAIGIIELIAFFGLLWCIYSYVQLSPADCQFLAPLKHIPEKLELLKKYVHINKVLECFDVSTKH